MAKKHYVAKKVGDQYELEAQSVEHQALSLGCTLGGGALLLLGLSRRSIPGMALAMSGAALVYQGVTGRNLIKLLMEQFGSDEGTPSETPSFPRDSESRASQVPRDEVEEASMGSFPASDPPAHSVARASPDPQI